MSDDTRLLEVEITDKSLGLSNKLFITNGRIIGVVFVLPNGNELKILAQTSGGMLSMGGAAYLTVEVEGEENV